MQFYLLHLITFAIVSITPASLSASPYPSLSIPSQESKRALRSLTPAPARYNEAFKVANRLDEKVLADWAAVWLVK